KAKYESAKAQVREAEAGLGRVQAEYEFYDTQYKRFESASTGQVIARGYTDEPRLRRDSARAAIGETQAKINSAKALEIESAALRDKAEVDVSVAKAHLEVAEADRDQMRATLDYARLPAPFDGVVTARGVDIGHFVQPAAGSASKGEPLFVVAQIDPVRICVDVPEAD